jgi:hypothetical protein
MRGRGLVLVATLALLAGCPNAPFTTCDAEPDLSGHWTFTLTPIPDGGLPGGDNIDAQLVQMRRPSGVGSLVWGTLTSSDKSFFDTLTIPRLTKNNGSKTGGVLACEIKINIPVTANVTDDDLDNGPLRLSLAGTIVARGMIDGDTSTIIREADTTMTQASFTWTGVQLPH